MTEGRYEQFTYGRRNSDGSEVHNLVALFDKPVTLQHAKVYLQGRASAGGAVVLYVHPNIQSEAR